MVDVENVDKSYRPVFSKIFEQLFSGTSYFIFKRRVYMHVTIILNDK